jgi:hypothetical protein
MGAKLVSGFEFIAADRALGEYLREVDLVVTGEGRLDRTSWQGKVVGGVVAAARAVGVPVLVVAGTVSEESAPDGAAGDAADDADRTGEKELDRDGAAGQTAQSDDSGSDSSAPEGSAPDSNAPDGLAPGGGPVTVISLTEMFGKAASFRDTANCIRRAVERYLVVSTTL